jgi:hypothetical protein
MFIQERLHHPMQLSRANPWMLATYFLYLFQYKLFLACAFYRLPMKLVISLTGNTKPST